MDLGSSSAKPGRVEHGALTVTERVADEIGTELGNEIGGTVRFADLAAADEVFMTSTTAGARPITEVDGAPVGAGRRGPVTTRVQGLYAEFVAAERRG
ncbi:MAG: hypothetical protein R8G01_14030 [Ilumatobacteraceae bacterium]|nr:hypothetical protein [Ilumatobacteraceae bacterium]